MKITTQKIQQKILIKLYNTQTITRKNKTQKIHDRKIK